MVFTDLDGQILPWITDDFGNIDVMPTLLQFIDFHDTQVEVLIQVSLTSDPTITISDSFSVYFLSTVLDHCYSSVIALTSTIKQPIHVSLTDPSPVELTLPSFIDSGSQALSMLLGFESETCGGFSVT